MQEMHQHEEMHAAEPARQPHVQFSRDSICVSRKMLLTVGVLVGVFALGMLVSSGINNAGKTKIATKSRASENLSSLASSVQTKEQLMSLVNQYELEFPQGDAFSCREFSAPFSYLFKGVLTLNKTNPPLWIVCEEGCEKGTGRCTNNSYGIFRTISRAASKCESSSAVVQVKDTNDSNSDYLFNCSDNSITYCASGIDTSGKILVCNLGKEGTEAVNNTIYQPVGANQQDLLSTEPKSALVDNSEKEGWIKWTMKDLRNPEIYKAGLDSKDKEFLSLQRIYGANGIMQSNVNDENYVKVREVDYNNKPLTNIGFSGNPEILGPSEQCFKASLSEFVNVTNIILNKNYSACSGKFLQFNYSNLSAKMGDNLYLVVTYDKEVDENSFPTLRNTKLYVMYPNKLAEYDPWSGTLPPRIRHMFFVNDLSGRTFIYDNVERPAYTFDIIAPKNW